MLKDRSFPKFLPALVLIAGACAQTAVAPPGLTLAQAVDQALKNNLQAKLAQERTTESRAQRGIGLSALLPNMSGAAYQMNLTENLAAQGLTGIHLPRHPRLHRAVSAVSTLAFQMVQSLFNLASIRHYQATRYGVQLAEQQRRLAEQQVTAATSLAYIGVLETGAIGGSRGSECATRAAAFSIWR